MQDEFGTFVFILFSQKQGAAGYIKKKMQKKYNYSCFYVQSYMLCCKQQIHFTLFWYFLEYISNYAKSKNFVQFYY